MGPPRIPCQRKATGLPIAQQEHPFELANAALHQTSEASSEHDSPWCLTVIHRGFWILPSLSQGHCGGLAPNAWIILEMIPSMLRMPHTRPTVWKVLDGLLSCAPCTFWVRQLEFGREARQKKTRAPTLRFRWCEMCATAQMSRPACSSPLMVQILG